MTINYTSLLGLAQPVTGTEANTWGTVVNDEITALIEEAIAGGETINVTAGNVTLTDTDGVPNQARNAILLITGTPGTSRNVIAPSTSKTYVVVNDSDSSVVIKGSATTGVTITAGDKALVAWNGSDFVRVGASAGGSNTQVQYNNNGNLAGSANMTFNGTRLTVNDFADSSLTAGRVTYATTSGNLTDSSTFTFDGSFLTVPGLKNSGLTSGRVTYATTNGQLTDAAGLTFNGTTLTATAGSFGDVTLTAQGDVRFADSDSSNYVAFQAPATVASNVTWTLPATDGTSGQFLSTDGAGILSWATASGGGGGGGTSVTVTQATATASQTTFNVTYTVGQLSVFLNGALLASADYTASNGTTVVLATGAASGDIFTALAYSSVTSISQLNTNVTVSDSGSNGTITFTTDGTEAMRINNSQNVGIGTNSISGDYFTGRLLQITGSSSAAIKFERTSATARKWEIGVTTGGNLDFADAVASTSVPRMRIDTSGQVGIGTTTTGGIFQAGATGNSLIFNNASYSELSPPTTGNDLIIFRSQNDGSFNFSSRPGGGGNYRFWVGSTQVVHINSSGYFKASSTGTYDSLTGTYHEFTGNDASNPALFIYNSNASFTNYVTSIYSNRNTTNATYYFLRCRVASVGDRLYIADSGNVTNVNGSYGTISDVKLKQDITDATSQWDDIKNLRFRKYRLKSEVEANPDAKSLLGLVAQEAELVSPGLIEEHKDLEDVQVPILDEDGNPVLDEEGNPKTEKQSRPTGTTTKSIKTSILYMKAVKALQEAQLRIETLEAQNAAFEARLSALEGK